MPDWVDVALRLAEKAVNKLFETPKGEDDRQLISPGLAVGYFYNFLDVISGELRRGFSLKKENGSEMAVNEDNANIEIIIPKWLRPTAFTSCERELKNADKGHILLTGQGRNYGINYRISSSGKIKTTTIVDLARPVMALKQYYENIIKIDTDPESGADQWRRIQLAEVEAFKKTLQRLQQRGYGVLVNRLTFRELE